MRQLRCERQSLLLLSATAVLGASNLFFLLACIRLVGNVPPIWAMFAVMAFYTWTACRGTLEALSVYRYDEDGIEKRHPLRRAHVRWDEVRDLRIRRSSGDSTVFLDDGCGRPLKVDFQLLGPAGAELFALLFARLDPIVEAKLSAMEQAPRKFARRHAGLFPLPGSVTAGGGMIRSGGRALPLEDVAEVAVREVKKLTATQEYALRTERARLQFLSYVDDGPLLVRYLRRHVPEERWTVARSSGVFVAKLAALMLVPVLAWAALTTLSFEAGTLGTDRALRARHATAQGTVSEVERLDDGRVAVSYSFGSGEEETFGSIVTRAAAPSPGQRLTIEYDPENRWMNRPAPGQGLDGPDAWMVLGPTLLMLLLSIPYTVATLAYKVREDPFAEWMLESGRPQQEEQPVAAASS